MDLASEAPPPSSSSSSSSSGEDVGRSFYMEPHTTEDLANAKKLIFYGSVLPKGSYPPNGEYDKFDSNLFTPEMTEKLSLDGSPFLRNHKDKLPIGKITSSTMHDGEKHVTGFVDMKDAVGAITAHQIMEGKQLHLSMYHDSGLVTPEAGGGWCSELRVVKEVSSVEEGARGPNHKIMYAALDSTLERSQKESRKMADPSTVPPPTPPATAAPAVTQPPAVAPVAAPSSSSPPPAVAATPPPAAAAAATAPPPQQQSTGISEEQAFAPENLAQLDKDQLASLLAKQHETMVQLQRKDQQREEGDRQKYNTEVASNIDEIKAQAESLGISVDDLLEAWKSMLPEGASLQELMQSGKALALTTKAFKNVAANVAEHKRLAEEATQLRQQALQSKGTMERNVLFDRISSSLGRTGLGRFDTGDVAAAESSRKRDREADPAAAAASASAPLSNVDPQMQPPPGKTSRVGSPDVVGRNDVFEKIFQTVASGEVQFSGAGFQGQAWGMSKDGWME